MKAPNRPSRWPVVLATVFTAGFLGAASAHAQPDPLPPEAAGLERGRSSSAVPRPPGMPTVPGMPQSPGGFDTPNSRTGSAGSTGPSFDPSTRGDPGFAGGARDRGSDRVYGPTGNNAARSNGSVGLSLITEDLSGYDDGIDAIRQEFHIVDDGDTLWGICTEYFKDPYRWPTIWALNPQMTNAHWIFPGDRVRLYDPSLNEPTYTEEPDTASALVVDRNAKAQRTLPDHFLVNRFALVADRARHTGMVVAGAGQAKVMMANLDVVYIGYDPRNPPIPGERLTIYRDDTPLHHWRKTRLGTLRKGRKIGTLREIVGEVAIESVSEKSAAATVVDSVRPIERGMQVGELAARFLRISPVEADKDYEGTIIETLRGAEMNGEDQFVVLNIGSSAGLSTGVVLNIDHRGDAFQKNRARTTPNVPGHPTRRVGRLMVVQVESQTSLALVIESKLELTKGDSVTASPAEAEAVISAQSLRNTGP